jgi:hypothetical protein
MRGMDYAQKSITGGLDKFSSMLAEREQLNQGAADRGRQASQEDYLNLVQSYKTPEELQAARMSGVLDQRLASLDPRNQAAVRGATESRITSLQQQATAGNAFADAAELRAQRPVEQQIAEARARGNYVEADRLTASLTINRGKEIDTNRTALRTRTAENAEDGLAAVRNPVALADAIALANLAPEARAQAVIAQRLKGTVLKDQERINSEQVEDRSIAAIAAKAKISNQNLLGDVRTGYGVLAKIRGFNLAPDGGPDVSRMTEPEITALTADGKAAGMPAFSTMLGGNTQQAAELRKSLKAQGFSDRGIVTAEPLITDAADTSSVGALVGNDRIRAVTAQATMDVTQKETDSRNRFAPGSSDALNTYEALAKELPGLAPDVPEDHKSLQAMLTKFATTGIKLKDGRYVTPSAQDIRGALREYEPKREWSSLGFKGNWSNDRQAKDIEASLKAMLESTDVTKLLQDATQSTLQNRDRDIRAQVKEALYPSKK